MEHEKLIEKHLGINTPYWVKEKVNNAINEALHQPHVNGSDTIKSCQNCKFYTADKNRCNHQYWSFCVKRDDKGYVTSYTHHHYR